MSVIFLVVYFVICTEHVNTLRGQEAGFVRFVQFFYRQQRFFCILLTVQHLLSLPVGDQIDAQFFYVIRLFQSSTCFEQTAVVQWLRYCATNRKVAGSIPDGVIGIFH